MANRKSSVVLQLSTAGVLSGAWAIARAIKKRRPTPCAAGYRIDAKAYGIISAALLLADLYAIPKVLRGKLDMNADEFGSINISLVPWIDRHALSFSAEEREHYRRISDRVLQGLVAVPFLLLLDTRVRRDWKHYVMLYAWLHALTYTIYSFSPLGPAFVDKYRPVVYYSDLPDAVRALGNNRNARFSGHTANGAAAAFFMAKAWSDYNPRHTAAEKGGRYLLAFGGALMLGWLRMKSLKHFPSDVLQAVLIGGSCGVLLPELYRCNDAADAAGSTLAP